jgi:transposase
MLGYTVRLMPPAYVKPYVKRAIRAHPAEFGIVAIGRNGVEQLPEVFADASDKRLPEIAQACVAALVAQLRN